MSGAESIPGIQTAQAPFLPGERYQARGATAGKLSGLTFAVKDNIDLCGAITGVGNPHWAATHHAATSHAEIVKQLLSEGASVIGKTITEEMAYSIIGDNRHFGIPLNPASPHRFAGGSSSGSASAVASGQVDFALGTDTAGSVRIPASNCGVFGIRPNHGALPMSGVVPLAPSFDVLGWFANSPDILARVGEVLLNEGQRTAEFEGFHLFEPAFAALPPDEQALFEVSLGQFKEHCLGRVDQELGWPAASKYAQAHRTLQSREAWVEHGSWVRQAPEDALPPDILSRFRAGRTVDTGALEQANEARNELRTNFLGLINRFEVIAIPTVPLKPLKIGSREPERDRYRQEMLHWTCLASLTGFPEITVPCVADDDCRLGLSLVGLPGSEQAMLNLIRRIM